MPETLSKMLPCTIQFHGLAYLCAQELVLQRDPDNEYDER